MGRRGDYRGIPNVIHPEGGFHPGAETCSTRLVEARRQRVVIASESLDGEWACTWTIGPDRAVMDLERVGHPHWILYEGTPGGRYDETQAYTVDAAAGHTNVQDGVKVAGGEGAWPPPDGFGPEVAVYVRRTSP